VIKVKITKLFLVLGVVLALGLMVGPAFAVTATPVTGGTETEVIYDGLVPVATITYQSDYEVLGYTVNDDIRLEADIIGVAEGSGYTVDSITYVSAYVRAHGNTYTPKNRVTGTWIGTGSAGDGYIDFEFNSLKTADDGAIGNAHFHMEYDVVWSGGSGGGTETVKFGMNCHAEE